MYEEQTFNKQYHNTNSIVWKCAQKSTIQCRVKIIIDTKVNKAMMKGKHNHGIVRERRKPMELKKEKIAHGLNPDYFKPRSKKSKNN